MIARRKSVCPTWQETGEGAEDKVAYLDERGDGDAVFRAALGSTLITAEHSPGESSADPVLTSPSKVKLSKLSPTKGAGSSGITAVMTAAEKNEITVDEHAKIIRDTHVKASSLLKLKISQMMDLLNQQLQIAEVLDERIRSFSIPLLSNIPIMQTTSFLEELLELSQLTQQELLIASKFNIRLGELI